MYQSWWDVTMCFYVSQWRMTQKSLNTLSYFFGYSVVVEIDIPSGALCQHFLSTGGEAVGGVGDLAARCEAWSAELSHLSPERRLTGFRRCSLGGTISALLARDSARLRGRKGTDLTYTVIMTPPEARRQGIIKRNTEVNYEVAYGVGRPKVFFSQS